MKAIFKKVAGSLGVILVGALLTATASAECGLLAGKPAASLKQQSWQVGGAGSASLLLVSDPGFGTDPIVGMWHVIFTAQGNGSDGPPDNAVIDNAIVVWHSDGTEIMNSGRPAQDGNFCMGVWQNQGRFGYKLNHFALGNDPSNAPTGIGNPAGPTHIKENILLGRNGNSYSGSFVLDAYDPAGTRVAHILGVISATRITVNTPVSTFF